jgi:recombination DNA repair RAD52 pathway protein
MGFSAKQVKALRRNLNHRYVRTREAYGRELSYIEGWYAISEANRIFSFDGWSRETVESRCVLARENRGAFLAVYTARVRISVQAGGSTIIETNQPNTNIARSILTAYELGRSCL